MLARFLNINETWWWRIVSETGTSLIEVFSVASIGRNRVVSDPA